MDSVGKNQTILGLVSWGVSFKMGKRKWNVEHGLKQEGEKPDSGT